MAMRKKTAGYWALNVVSILLAVIFIGPILWALAVSFQKEGKQIKSVVDWFTPPYTLENYPAIILNSEVPTWLINSLVIAVVVTLLTVIFSAMAAYAIAKLPFKGSKGFFMYFLLGLMVPGEATIVPLFITVNGMNLIDTYAGMILPAIAGSMNLIIMVTFFRGLPNELLEAVKIDGGGEITTFFKIVFPLSKTIIATVCIFSFVGSWNNYLWPLLCAMSNDLFTLPVGIPTFAGTYTVDYVRPMTASMVASLPMIIIYIIFEKQIVAGITSGAVKG
ncbi:MAG: carbohydrate ABC transporter permease [Firmicutes bacterium]|nr:carbohydrate ABC transporter permease [Bacillota bacterium]